MASLFVEYIEKKTSVFQIQLEFWVNMTLCFWLMYSPTGKVGFCPELQLFQSFPTKVAQNDQFCLICNFSNLFPLKWLRMTRNGQFHLIHNFSNLSPPKWLRMTWNTNFARFATFPIFSHQSGSE